MQARRHWQEIFKFMKSKDLQPRLLYPAKLLFRIKGEIKSFPDKKNLEVITTKPVLQEMLKCVLEEEEEEKIKNMSNKMATNI